MKNVTQQNNITNERIKELREEKGMTQEELRKKLFISREALANFETRREIPRDKLKEFANYFDTTVDYLLGKTNVKSKDNVDYQLIGKYTGLNDKSIKVLGDLFRFAPEIIETINYLIAQEEFSPINNFSVFGNTEDKEKMEKKAEENFNKINDYWEDIHFPILSKITNYYNVEFPKETLCITENGIKNKKDFKSKYEMIRETKAKISAKNLVDKGLLEEVEYQLKNSKENKNNKTKQKEQNKQMQKLIEEYNKYGTIEEGEEKK